MKPNYAYRSELNQTTNISEMGTTQFANPLDNFLISINQQKSTGTLLCVDHNAKLARIYFEQGVAVTARYNEKHGTKALDSIKTTHMKSAKFHTNRDLVLSKHKINSHHEKPQNHSINLLNRHVKREFDKELSTHVLRLLRKELTVHVGPIANFLIDDLDKNLSLRQATRLLSLQISDKESATQFANSVKRNVQH